MLSYEFSKFRSWNYTTCIHSDNITLVEQALTRIFEQEGYIRIDQPPLPQNSSAIATSVFCKAYCR
jgi:hypothetical protein